MLRHPSGLFAISPKVNDLENQYGLFWLVDFIAGSLKRVRKDIKGAQEWRFSLDGNHRAVLKVLSVSVLHPQHRRLYFTFKFSVLDYTGPPLSLYLEDGVLLTEEERDAEI